MCHWIYHFPDCLYSGEPLWSLFHLHSNHLCSFRMKHGSSSTLTPSDTSLTALWRSKCLYNSLKRTMEIYPPIRWECVWVCGWVRGRVSECVHAWASEWVCGRVSECVGEWVSACVGECVLRGRVSECVRERVSTCVRERVSACVRGPTSECVSAWVGECVVDWERECGCILWCFYLIYI